jgi:hypothetical protein
MKREWHVTMEVEIGVMCLQNKEHQGLPANTRNQKKARKDSSLDLQLRELFSVV